MGNGNQDPDPEGLSRPWHKSRFYSEGSEKRLELFSRGMVQFHEHFSKSGGLLVCRRCTVGEKN